MAHYNYPKICCMLPFFRPLFWPKILMHSIGKHGSAARAIRSITKRRSKSIRKRKKTKKRLWFLWYNYYSKFYYITTGKISFCLYSLSHVSYLQQDELFIIVRDIQPDFEYHFQVVISNYSICCYNMFNNFFFIHTDTKSTHRIYWSSYSQWCTNVYVGAVRYFM